MCADPTPGFAPRLRHDAGRRSTDRWRPSARPGHALTAIKRLVNASLIRSASQTPTGAAATTSPAGPGAAAAEPNNSQRWCAPPASVACCPPPHDRRSVLRRLVAEYPPGSAASQRGHAEGLFRSPPAQRARAARLLALHRRRLSSRRSAERVLACQEHLQSSRCRWMTACAASATGAAPSAAWRPRRSAILPPVPGRHHVRSLDVQRDARRRLALVQALALGRRLALSELSIVASACCTALGVEIPITIARVAGPVGYAVAFRAVVAGGNRMVLADVCRRRVMRAPERGGCQAS